MATFRYAYFAAIVSVERRFQPDRRKNADLLGAFAVGRFIFFEHPLF